MANPPPVRPWFRLASIRSTPAPAPSASAPAPAPEARPILPLPAFRTASAPSSPQIQPAQEKRTPSPPSQPQKLSTSLPSSPIRKPPSPSPDKTTTQSPKTIKQTDRSPMHSPNNKPTAPPPSPLTLPPSQLKAQPNIPTEAEPKTVLVQKTVDRPKPWHNGTTAESSHRETRSHGNSHHHHHGKHVTTKESEAREKGTHRKVLDSEESGMRVITIAGENRGAYMELIQSPKKHESKYLHKKGNSSINVDGAESESSGGQEGNVNNKKDKGHKTTSSFPMAAYMNSNVQCVNNSLLYHTSCSHHDPGVRLSLTKKSLGEGYHLKEYVDGHNT
ncbi:hypothetical protein VNO77_18701 [Canavalia gladiata]|uniref:Uncharacterized protein n=1 Tax=Canavalia gladiata TaxID=3824 RepID=A0AAN9QJW0_CANGL